MKEKIREILWNFVAGEVTDSEAVQQVLDLFAVVGQSEQLESGLTCMMCRKPKQNDGHTCCEECAGLAF